MSDKKSKHHLSDISSESSETLEHGGYKDEAMQQIHAQLMREKEEPQEGFAPIPIFLLFLFGGLMFWGGLYVAENSGAFRSDVFDPHWRPGADATAVVTVFDPIKQGKKLFTRQCQQCHQADAQGIPGVYPPLAESKWVLGDEVLPIKILLLGLNGEIEVRGNTYNGNMPAVATWKDRDIAAVLTYIRTKSDWGNDASAVEEAAVTAVRESLEGRADPWEGQELLREHPL